MLVLRPLFRSFLIAASLAAGMVAAAAQQPRPQQPPAPTPEQIKAAQELEKALSAPMVPTHLVIAAEVLKASGLNTMFDNAMPNVVGALRVNITRQRPELTKDIEEALKLVEEDAKKVTTDGINGAARLLAIRMSEPELKEVNTFLTSAVGKKYIDTLPILTEQLVPFIEIWAQETQRRLTKVFFDEMTKRGHRL
ncbi:MAG: DUF2059 domain-containing protein [Proteobacteria bacterium]|nr:DUF2059 domain-containing protein [Pseudomonadota bacterium]